MPTPGDYSLTVYRGDDWRLVLNLLQPDDTAVDLTGATVAAQVRKVPAADTITATITAGVTDPTGGEITLTLDAATTATLESSGYWDLQVTDSAGTVTTWLAGRVSVTGDVTRSA